MVGRLLPFVLGVLLAGPSAAAGERVRVATYDVDLSRDGPGLLLRELRRPPEPGLAAVIAVIQAARPDILLLNQFDHDLRGEALGAFRGLLAAGPEGIDYPYWFDAPVNAGVPSGRDLDGDGRTMGWNDALGWGKFPGDGGMAILSRYPVDAGAARTFRLLPWAARPGAEGLAGTPLSSRAHWEVPVLLPDGTRLRLLAANPTPPLHGAENVARNDAEIALWADYLDGAALADDAGRAAPLAPGPLLVLGNLNTDPADGAGRREGLARLLSHPRLRDPLPESAGGEIAATPGHRGAPELDTAAWKGPGNLRVDYALPSRELGLLGAGVFWPAPGAPLADLVAAGPAHRLVWVDVAPPSGP